MALPCSLAFAASRNAGAASLRAVAPGISEALITTAFGLLVAIPAVMIYNYFQSVMEAVTVDISESSNELLDVVATLARPQHTGIRPGAAA